MAKKNIAITINHAPYSGNFCMEGLRSVVGTHLAINEQEVKTLFLGDGVFFGIKTLKEDGFTKFTETLKSMGMEFYLEEESIQQRKIEKTLIREDFKILSRQDIFKILQESDHTLSY